MVFLGFGRFSKDLDVSVLLGCWIAYRFNNTKMIKTLPGRKLFRLWGVFARRKSNWPDEGKLPLWIRF